MDLDYAQISKKTLAKVFGLVIQRFL